MSYIFSTDTTLTAINKINNRLSGYSYDNPIFLWTTISAVTSPDYGASIFKRDENLPNKKVIPFSDNCFYAFLGGGGNSANTQLSIYNTIICGTGNTIDYFFNSILSGSENKISELTNSFVPAFNFNSILSGTKNRISGLNNGFNNSVIFNGSGNTMFDLSVKLSYNPEYTKNSLLNGLSNNMNGIMGYSWIGNGSGNTIQTTTTEYTVSNYILNGHNNTISNSSTNNGYNTIIGGNNNSITDKNNSIVIGSNITASNDNTTHVNRLFYDKKIFFNNYTYLEITNANFPSFISPLPFNHNNKSVGIIKRIDTQPGDPAISLFNGTYTGQILYLIAIPSKDTSTAPYLTKNIVIENTKNVVLGSSNTISLSNYLNPLGSGTTSTYDETTFAGLSIFTWNGNYWIRADHRGGI
jgi:hypothetical protein